MKNAISSVWLLGLVVLFIFLFAGYLAVTINYTKTFKVKSEMLTMIEKQKGVVDISTPTLKPSIVRSGRQVNSNIGSLQVMCLYLYGSGYRTTGTCDTITEASMTGKWYGVKSLGVPSGGSGNVMPEVEEVVKGHKYYFCFSKGKNKNNSIFYRIQVFYKMEFPVIGDVSSFRVQGTTAEIFNEACPAAETWCHK
jgi:hypothetical protein